QIKPPTSSPSTRHEMKRQIAILELSAEACSFRPPFEEDHALLLVIASPLVSVAKRDRIVSEILRSRCQYVLVSGHDCEVWHDAVDKATSAESEYGGRFLMTTWHDEEPIEDVIDFLWWNTSYEEFESELL